MADINKNSSDNKKERKICEKLDLISNQAQDVSGKVRDLALAVLPNCYNEVVETLKEAGKMGGEARERIFEKGEEVKNRIESIIKTLR